MVAIAPLQEVDAVRALVLIDVAVHQAVRAAAHVAMAFLDRRFRLDPDRTHFGDVSDRSLGGGARGRSGRERLQSSRPERDQLTDDRRSSKRDVWRLLGDPDRLFVGVDLDQHETADVDLPEL